ncbi:MAG: site-specific integrase, partial [Coriobacteriia bacterium]|nr:site-specific integrase [Coriobacteriia bacterium]
VNDDIILRNPCDRVEAPKAPKAKKGAALDKDGVVRLAKALKDAESKSYPHAKDEQQRLTSDMAHVAAVRLALGAGLRRGEVLGLLWGDVDLVCAQINIHQSLSNITGELASTKTESGNRVIALSNQAVLDLIRWKNRQEDYLKSLGIKQDDKTPVISNDAGGHLDGDNLARWWRRFQMTHGFEGLRFHDLRHTHATMLVSSGLNIKAVSSRLGHASVGITLDLYAHAQREDDKKAAAIIGQIMSADTSKEKQVANL